jgi:hypothetical protein
MVKNLLDVGPVGGLKGEHALEQVLEIRHHDRRLSLLAGELSAVAVAKLLEISLNYRFVDTVLLGGELEGQLFEHQGE